MVAAPVLPRCWHHNRTGWSGAGRAHCHRAEALEDAGQEASGTGGVESHAQSARRCPEPAQLGDAPHSRGSVFEVRMSLRHGGRDVAGTAAELACAFSDARPTVAVFLHGLGEQRSVMAPPRAPSVG